jgi:hypothetical protein
MDLLILGCMIGAEFHLELALPNCQCLPGFRLRKAETSRLRLRGCSAIALNSPKTLLFAPLGVRLVPYSTLIYKNSPHISHMLPLTII